MSYENSPPPPPPGNYGQPGQMGQPYGAPPPNHLVWAIVTTVLCCLPLGVASIVFAAQVNSKWQAGDVRGAQEASEKAKKFAIWAAIAGVVVAILYLVFFFVIAANAPSTATSLGAL